MKFIEELIEPYNDELLKQYPDMEMSKLPYEDDSLLISLKGETVTEIAQEKMYIIKQNIPSVSAEQLPSVKKIGQIAQILFNTRLRPIGIVLGISKWRFDLRKYY